MAGMRRLPIPPLLRARPIPHAVTTTIARGGAAAVTRRSFLIPPLRRRSLLLHNPRRPPALPPPPSRPRPPPPSASYATKPATPTSSRPTTESTPKPPPTSPTDPEPFDLGSYPPVPYRFATGLALFAKRPPRPFPPPFLSPPSASFSDPLSTFDRSRDRRKAYIDGHRIQGHTNGDDAVFASAWFVGANDGVGAWSARPRGHAGLWARLILHYWATALYTDAVRQGEGYEPQPVAYLQRAYERTVEATRAPNDWQGTTTAAGAQLHYRRGEGGEVQPLLYVTNVGDSQVMVVRPATGEMVYKSEEQWHWFDCPRQLGTNSPDTPAGCAVVDEVVIREGDVVLAMSDGVIDNLWTHEIVACVCGSVERWRAEGEEGDEAGMRFVAEELKEAARRIAVDPFAESPFMEHAIEEGLASEGGKLDDISVVAALCKKNE